MRGGVLDEDQLREIHEASLRKSLEQQAQIRVDPKMQELSDKLEAADTAAGIVVQQRLDKLQQPEDVRLAVGVHEGKVVMNFATPVSTLGMAPAQAMKIGRALMRHARRARKHG